ncbi:hypothetical protein A5320_02595 [Rheinheimera sp. SA_1]|uniref:hypothetical protein n=1 Tax=Rheinheimera sp. SA_1 TaxID=1827365 RepID=UPI0007FC462B|nr:hypothetical protein [Rheinheimera sp. SA_1]OBP16316.1 hypothetical protein A5320_02595 [Rheinheimera sp. SA_1]
MSKGEFKADLKVQLRILYEEIEKIDQRQDVDDLIYQCCSFFQQYVDGIIDNCEYNYSSIGDQLINRVLGYGSSSNDDRCVLALIFYRFLIEHSIVVEHYKFTGRDEICTALRSYIDSYYPSDDSVNVYRNYSFNLHPSILVHNRVNVKIQTQQGSQQSIIDELSKYKDSDFKVSQVLSQLEKWDSSVDEKFQRIESLNKELQNLSSSYNFANISHGFQNLLKSKKASLHLNSILIFILTVILVAPPMFKIFTGLYPEPSVYGTRIDLTSYLINYIPFVALDFFVLYFFRIVLSTRKEITTQVVQLELRKSLCQFIESYSERSKEMSATTPKLLEKFETLIFSGLTTDPTNVPTTFDGLEQLANMIKSIKNA